MTAKIATSIGPSSFVIRPTATHTLRPTIIKNNNFSKIQKTALASLVYVKDAIKVFFLDLYNSFFSWRIITKIPFFIFFYGFWTAFGAVDTIYYVALTIFVLKASKDLIASLSDRNILRKFSEYFPLKNRLDALKTILKGASFGPFLFALDRYLTKFLVKSFQFFKLKVFDENKLIYQGGFLGGFSTFYAILIYPVIKEVLFRGYIESYFSDDTKNKETSESFLKTAIKTAVIFGIYHFSPTGGLLNIPIIVVNIALGLIYSSLNHKKNNLWASSACSIVNAFFLTANLKYLKFS